MSESRVFVSILDQQLLHFLMSCNMLYNSCRTKARAINRFCYPEKKTQDAVNLKVANKILYRSAFKIPRLVDCFQ